MILANLVLRMEQVQLTVCLSWTLIRYQKQKRKPLYLCFVDFTKAFDYINRNALYYKLMTQKIGNKMLTIIMSMYDKAKARVNKLGNMGAPIENKCGVLQGGVLSPKLFNEYLSDLANYLNMSDGITMGNLSLTHISYADDIVLVANSSKSLQSALESLHKFCKKWHLILNVGKTKVMKFGVNTEVNFDYNGHVLENVNIFKYLGHVLTNKRNIHAKMTEYLATQAQKALFAIQGDTKETLGHISPLLSIKMFDTYILPILEYNSEIWANNTPVKELEKIQLKYLKYILGVRKQTPSLAVYGETGRFPLHIRQQIRMITYWAKLEKMPESNILAKCLIIQKSLKNNWYDKMFNILSELFPYMDQNMFNPNVIVKRLKTKIYQTTQEKILAEISDSTLHPKLRTYKLFKSDYRIEPYLILNLSKKCYRKIARFRVSSHNLRIETGRHVNPIIPLENRTCLKCDMHVVENEMHCLLICPNGQTHREDLIRIANMNIGNFVQLNTEEKFKTIMSTKEPELIKSIGKFLVNIDV